MNFIASIRKEYFNISLVLFYKKFGISSWEAASYLLAVRYFCFVENSFKTIAVYQYSSEAQIIKGRLEADGIEVFLADTYTIDTDPLVSNAIGGVKLKVRSAQVIKAKRIIDNIATYSLDDEGNPIQCPNCGSKKAHLFTQITDLKSFFSFLVGVLFSVLPFHTTYTYHCEACDHKFNAEWAPIL